MFSHSTILAVVSLLTVAGPVLAQTTKSTLSIPRVQRPPRIEDFLENRQREREAVVTGFRQREPHDGDPVTRETLAFLSYDDHNLYAVFVCHADPKTVRARMTRRDAIAGDETVNISLDTFHDRRRAYMFFANPLGVQLDGVTTEGQDDDFTFDTVWRSSGRLTADGYVVWMAIPFKSLRFPDSPQQNWGIALTRYIPENKEFSTFPRITQKVEGYVEQFATLEGLEQIAPSHNVQLQPYGFLSKQLFLDSPETGAPGMRRQGEFRGGVDGKVVLRDALTLDVMLNPDFSQIESDEPQVTLNQRFEVFFPERRPFFQENAGFFETPETLFFSRRVVDPQFGMRLTGKVGPWAIGLLGTDDRRAEQVFSREEGDRHNPVRAGVAVARIQREIGRQSAIGALVTSRDIGNSSNRVFSFDSRLRLNSNWVFTGQAMRSETKEERLRSSGNAFFSEIRHTGRHLTYASSYRDRDPEFRADLGFIPRVDLRQIRQSAAYRWRPETGNVLNFGPSIVSFINWDHAGRMQDWFVETPFRVEFKGPTLLEVARAESWEFYRGRGFRKNNNAIYFSSDRFSRLGVTASLDRGRSVNFFPAAGLTPFSADSTEGRIGFRLRPTRRMRLDETYLYSHLAMPNGRNSVFNSHILRSRANYQFTRAVSLRAIVDYNGVLPNLALVDLGRSKRVTADLLATLLLNPGTAVYVGWSDRRENLSPDFLSRIGPPSLLTSRVFFVKLSYLLRL